MNLVDVNVLVYARRRDAERHLEYKRWLSEALSAGEPVAIASQTIASAVRILTHPRIWHKPLGIDEALEFGDAVRSAPAALILDPAERHWEIFSRLCQEVDASGNLVMDAWLAALAIEHNCVLISTDGDFARFSGLRVKHPLQ